MNTCTNCGFKEEPPKNINSGWWHLADYFGIWGFFCPSCFEKVSHNSSREPNHPEEYMKIWKKQNETQRGH